MIKIEISTDSAAFDDDAGTEVARILHQLADYFIDWQDEGKRRLFDVNGNRVGYVDIDSGTL